MKIYIKFFTLTFLKSLLYVISIMFSLIFILNLLTELEFFKEIDVSASFPIFLSLLNSPSMLFEMLPFFYGLFTIMFAIILGVGAAFIRRFISNFRKKLAVKS